MEQSVTDPTAGAGQSRIQAWFAGLSPWRRRGVALLAGALATLGHAPFQLTLIFAASIVVLVLLLDAAAKRERKIAAAFSMGWFFALGHFSTGLYWIVSAFLPESIFV